MRRAILITAALIASPSASAAQVSSPCEASCAVLLGLSSYATATGALVVWGRATGGISKESHSATIWATTFFASVGAGLSLNDEGRRQRAANGGGVGILVGSATGYLVGALATDSDSARWASLLIGAGAGALLGGIYGAVSYEETFPGPSTPTTLFAVRLGI